MIRGPPTEKRPSRRFGSGAGESRPRTNRRGRRDVQKEDDEEAPWKEKEKEVEKKRAVTPRPAKRSEAERSEKIISYESTE